MFAPTTKKMLISAVQRSFERKWKYWCLSRAAPLHPSLDYECSVLLADIQNLNSNAIAPQYFNVCNILRGGTAFRQDEDNVESFSSSGSVMRLPVSTPGLVQQLLWFIRFFSSVSTARFIDIITKQSFPNLNISIKHRQIGGQNVRFALHNRFWITVGCLLLWRKICWFQQSRGWLKGSGSSDVWQVSVGPTRASRLDPSLD